MLPALFTIDEVKGEKAPAMAQPNGRQQRTIIGVLGSGQEPWVERSVRLGEWIGTQGFDLLTGGGQGVMASVSRGFCGVSGRRGVSLGIIPANIGDGARRKHIVPKDGYPNEWVDIPIYTHLVGEDPLGEGSRNHINVLTATLLIALPGGKGTRSEVELALNYGTPVIAYGEPTQWNPALPDELCYASDLDAVVRYITIKMSERRQSS